jgi:hypothetical protein
MARSRNIKPSFFTNDDLAECDCEARILFIALWCIADREGRLTYRPKKIKVEALPYDDCDIVNLIEQLCNYRFIFIYSNNGKQILQINKWSKHQNPHHKEIESELPSFDDEDSTLVQGSANHEPNTVCDGYIPLSNTIRARIFERDGKECAYCKSEESLHIDHIIPISKGGNSTDDNLQVLCRTCNVMKSNNIINQDASIAHGKPMLESSMNQEQAIEIDSCPTDSLNLIPDSCSLIPDTGNLNTANQNLQNAQKSETKKSSDDLNNKFEKFWDLYPNKVDKKRASTWFKTNKPNDITFHKIIEGLKKQLLWREAKPPKDFVSEWKMPTTWLNGANWEDELKPWQIRSNNQVSAIGKTQENFNELSGVSYER